MIHGVYGLYAMWHKNNVTDMLQELEKLGLNTIEFKHMKVFALETYLTSGIKRLAEHLDSTLKDGDSILAHSFGAAIVYYVLQNTKKKLHNIYLFNAALSLDYILNSNNVDTLYNFYDPTDRALSIAEAIPYDIMGGVGKIGYRANPLMDLAAWKTKNIQITGGVNTLTNHFRAFQDGTICKYATMIKQFEDK